jgi:predicted MPP superfamily phosphohydrolase
MKRRHFFKKSLIAGAGLSLCSGLYAWQVEPFWLEFVHSKMPIKNLPKHLVGKTLMQISDVHIGNRFNYQYIVDSFVKAQTYNPDIVVYTGDYVNYENEEQFIQLNEVLPFFPKGTKGSVAVLGNHDYGHRWQQNEVAHTISQSLQKHGISVLRNQATEIEGLHVLGIDDYWATNFAPEKVMSQFKPNQANIVLCHNPDVCDLEVWNGYNSWILSGHTHGGQCKPPFLAPPILPVQNKSYTQGQIQLSGGRTLYINRALGHLWQVRVNVRPEITIFELQQA